MDVSAFDIKERFDLIASDRTIFSYLGGLDRQEMNQVLKKMEGILEEKVEKKIIKKRLFNILIEIVQNLYNYTDGLIDSCTRTDIFLFVNETHDGYLIVTGNFLKRKEIPGIRTRIDMVNAMSESEVKDLYRGILNFGGVSDGGGAGLGIVDLARRSGRKLVYKFEDIDEKFSFFTLEVTVK